MDKTAGDDDRWEEMCAAADAYATLGMAREALDELAGVAPGSPGRAAADYRIMRINVAEGRYAEAIAVGQALERGGHGSAGLSDWIGTAHQLAGQNLEALEAWRPLWPFFWNKDAGCHGMACALSMLGRQDEAARWLVRGFGLSGEFHAKGFFDVETEPLLRHAAEGPLGQWAIHFAHPAVARALAHAAAWKGEIMADAPLRALAPDRVRRWMEASLVNTQMRLRPRAPRDIRDEYMAWQAKRLRAHVALGERGVARAKRWILDRQIEWATAHAREGNFAGARYHVLFLIAHRPEEYERIEKVMRPLGLGYLFDDLGSVPRDAAVQLAGAWVGWVRESNGPREGLEKVGEGARRCGLGLLLEGAALKREGHLEDADAAYEASSRHWPGDPAPVANRIMMLIAMGRWDDAEDVYYFGPEWGAAFAAWWVLGERIVDRDSGDGTFPGDVFYGQPDLGGILAPGWEIPVMQCDTGREDG